MASEKLMWIDDYEGSSQAIRPSSVIRVVEMWDPVTEVETVVFMCDGSKIKTKYSFENIIERLSLDYDVFDPEAAESERCSATTVEKQD